MNKHDKVVGPPSHDVVDSPEGSEVAGGARVCILQEVGWQARVSTIYVWEGKAASAL